MKLNLLFSVKNIVLLLLALFYLLIFTHNLLGNIFEGYENSDPITTNDDAATVQNKLDLQNASAEMSQNQNGAAPPPASTGDAPPLPPDAGGDGSQPVQGFEDKKDEKEQR